MVGVFHVLVSIIAFSMHSSAVPVARRNDAVKDEFLRAIARDEYLVAQSLLQTSATLRRWGAQHSAQLNAPVIAAAKAAESLIDVAKTQEVAAAESLSHASNSLEQLVSWPVADAPPVRSFRKVNSHLVASQAAIEVEAVHAQPEAGAPSLLQTSEAEGNIEGSRTDVGLGTRHAVVRGLPVRLSDWQGDSAESWPSLNMMALLGVIAGFAVLMLQLSSSSQPSVTGQLGGRKSWGMQLQGPMQECGACATDRGS